MFRLKNAKGFSRIFFELKNKFGRWKINVYICIMNLKNEIIGEYGQAKGVVINAKLYTPAVVEVEGNVGLFRKYLYELAAREGKMFSTSKVQGGVRVVRLA